MHDYMFHFVLSHLEVVIVSSKNTTVLCKFSQLNLVKHKIVFPLVLTHPHVSHPETHMSKTGKEMEKEEKSAVLMTPTPR